MEQIIKKLSVFFGSLASVAFFRWIVSRNWGKCKPQYKVVKKNFIVTGGNSGIGFEISKYLYSQGAHVILACRNEIKAHNAIELIKKSFKHDKNIGQIFFIQCDLNSINSIKKFVNEIESRKLNIFGLINNAGIFNYSFSLNQDGFESQFMVNHLGNVLLTELLLSNLIKTSTNELTSKVIFVNSTLYKKGTIDDNFFIPYKMNEKIYEKTNMYHNSKLANFLYARALAEKVVNLNLPIYVNITSPGIVFTNLFRHTRFKWIKFILFSPLLLFILRTPKEGSQTILECVLANQASSNGNFYRNCKKFKYNKIIHNISLCKYVYKKSIEILQLK